MEEESEAAEQLYVNARRDLVLRRLRDTWAGEPRDEAWSKEQLQSYEAALAPLGKRGGVHADCRTNICKISVTIESAEMAELAERMEVPSDFVRAVQVHGDGRQGRIDELEFFLMKKRSLVGMFGSNLTGVVGPGIAMAPESEGHP